MVIFLAATTVKVKEPKRSRALVRQETIASYIFLLPSLIFFVGFVIYPMVLCVVTSFFDSTMNRADVFVGLANYKELFADPIFIGALKNTFIIVVVSVLAFKRSLAAGILDGAGAGADVALGGSRLARFMKEIEAVTGAGTQLLEALASAGQPADGGPAHGPAKLRRMSGSRPVRTHFCAM